MLTLFYIISDGKEQYDIKIKLTLMEQKEKLLLWQILHSRQFNFVA